MQISILLMKQIAELFLMILMGYVMVKAGIVKDEDSKVISKVVLYLIVPCVIIGAFQVDYSMERVASLLLVMAASLLLQVLLLFFTWLTGKIFHLNEVEFTSIYYSNSGNLIVPLVTYILGKDWVLYGCVFMCIQLVFLWTHCRKLLSKTEKIDWRKIVLNINMISIVIGVILFFTKIRLPEIINQTLSSVGSMVGPASMIVTGMLIAGMNLRSIFTNKRIYFISLLRLMFIPATALMILKVSGLAALQKEGVKLLLVVFLAVITPSASTVTQMCQVYGNDSKYAGAINVMTTLLSIFTMPLMVLIYQAVI